MAGAQLASLQLFLEEYPSIKYTLPSSPEYPLASHVWNAIHSETPLAIVRPQTPSDVSALVKFTKSKGIPFTVRTGGHNVEGRSIRQDTLTIDMRGLSSVDIATDRRSATICGGCLLKEIATKLWHEGLSTPLGVISSVGYVGWATYGGYGPLSPLWGLGVDQIIGATIVNADGEIIKADSSLLKGIRGAGGLFGIIVDLTIKVYPSTGILAGVILYDSQTIGDTFKQFNTAYEKLQADGLSLELSIQQLVFNGTSGRTFGVILAWNSDDMEEGQRWIQKIASLGPVVMNNVVPTNLLDWMTGNEDMIPATVYGSNYTHNIYRITEVAETIAGHLEKLPSDPSTMFSIHQLRGFSASERSDSVFASREPHYMLEILGCATTRDLAQESQEWAFGLCKELQEKNSESILPTAYINLGTNDGRSSTLSRYFGNNVPDMVTLKKQVDPGNVFNLTIPKLS